MEQDLPKAAQLKATSAKQFARALMWTVLMADENMLVTYAHEERGMYLQNYWEKKLFKLFIVSAHPKTPPPPPVSRTN